MKTEEKHYVIFHSPGTMFDETTSREIESWSTEQAASLAKEP